MKTVMRSLLLTVTLWVMWEEAASNPEPDPQFQFGPFVFHPKKSIPRCDCYIVVCSIISGIRNKHVTITSLYYGLSVYVDLQI